MVFQYKTPRRKREELRPAAVQAAEAEEEAVLIQGQAPGSKEEGRVAKALDKYNIEYTYQYPIYGGWMRGGFIVDFVLFNPFAIALEIFGEYWHSGQFTENDRLRLAAQAQYFGRETAIFWGNELQTQQAADARVRREFL